jgi:hypothetical protein
LARKGLDLTIVVAKTMVTHSNGDMVGGHLMGNLSRGLHNGLHHRMVGHSMSNWEDRSVMSQRECKAMVTIEKSRVGISRPFANMVSAKAIGKSSMVSSHGKRGSSHHSRGLHHSMVGSHYRCGMNSNGDRDRVDCVMKKRRVVDEGGGGRDDSGVSVQDCGFGISRPLAIVVAITMVSHSNRDMVGSHLLGHLGRGLHNGLHHRVVGHSMGDWEDRSVVSQRECKAMVTIEKSRVGISRPLANMVSAKTIGKSSMVSSSHYSRGLDHSMVGGHHRCGMNSNGDRDRVDCVVKKGRVVDKGGGGRDDSGVSVQDCGFGISRPLAIVGKPSVVGSGHHSRGSHMVGSYNRCGVNSNGDGDRVDCMVKKGRVVDEGGGGRDDSGVSV